MARETVRPGTSTYANCPYCGLPIPIDDFQPWTVRANLLSAACRSCCRTVSMAATTLQRLTHPNESPA